ncbi:MAG: glycosyltransferase [Ferruginibacter sp.]
MTPDYWLTNTPILLFTFFCIVAAIQVFYALFFFVRLAFYQRKKTTVSQTHPVSVIICARDEAENLSQYLPGILMQHYPTSHEVIVVNDNSYDDSKYFLEALQKEFKQLRSIELTQEAQLIPGKKFPLAVGIKSAKHEILLLTDADCIPASERWIDAMQSTYDDQTDIVLGYSPYFKKNGFLNKLIRWECYHTALQYMSYALAGLPYMGVGRNLSYRKAVFFRHKGFATHHHLPGGDDDLFVNMSATKKNTRIQIDPDSFVPTKPANSWSEWVRQKNRHYSVSRHYRWYHQVLLGGYSLSQFLFYPLLIASSIAFHPWIPLSVYGGRMLLQGFIHFRVSRKLNEPDLFPLFPFFDLWMFLYYLLFLPSLIRKPRPTWK